jgi:hypothetical protein
MSKRRPREYLIEAEIERLMAAAKDNRHGHRDAIAILVAYRHARAYPRFMSRTTFFACLLVVVVPIKSWALSGAELHALCQDRSPKLTACDYFILGFADGLIMGHENGLIAAHSNARWYCPPNEGLTVFQGRLVVEKYLIDHPEYWQSDAGLLVFGALTKAFPCAGK